MVNVCISVIFRLTSMATPYLYTTKERDRRILKLVSGTFSPSSVVFSLQKLFFKWIYFLQKLFLSGYTFDLSEIFEIFLTVSMMVSLDNMQPGESVDEWHSLIPVNLTFKGDVGSLRVKSRYLHEVIMPLKEYTSLKEVRH